MANYNGFGEANYVGQIGQQVMIRMITKTGEYVVLDVSQFKSYREKGDLLVRKIATGETRVYEVKTDDHAHTTGNLAIEVMSNWNYGKKGWIHTEQADIFIFYLRQSNEFIRIDGDDLRKYYKDAYVRSVTTRQNDNGYWKEGEIWLCSIEKLKELCPSFRRNYCYAA